jgi:DME family drug/metabolite transporter
VLWGTGGLAGALLRDATGLHPLAVASYRLLLGGLLATAVLAATGGLRIARPRRIGTTRSTSARTDTTRSVDHVATAVADTALSVDHVATAVTDTAADTAGPAGRLAGVDRSGRRSAGGVNRAATRRLLASGALLALFQACYFASISVSSVSLATMITIGSVPVFVAVASAVGSRQRPDAATTAMIGLAVVGLGLLAGGPGPTSGWSAVLGVATALLSGAGFAALTMLNRTPVPGLEPAKVTALGCLTGGVLLLPLAALTGLGVPTSVGGIAVALYLGAVPTALAYAAYYRGLRDAQPTTAALATVLEPLTATVLAVLLFDERLGATGWVGAALLAVAVIGSQLTGSRATSRGSASAGAATVRPGG